MDRRHLLLAGLSAPLAACVATPYGIYYRPTSTDPGARVRRAWCGGQAGPGSVLQVDAPLGLKLEATTDKPYTRRNAAGVPLRVQITLPTAAPLRFGPVAPMLLDPASGRPIAAPIAARVSSSVQLASDAVVDAMALRPAGSAGRSRDALVPQGRASWTLQLPADFAPPSIALQLPVVLQQRQPLTTPPVLLSRPGSARRPGDYRSEAELPDGLPAFELRLPPVQVGGQTVSLAPLLFERRSFDGGIEPFNC